MNSGRQGDTDDWGSHERIVGNLQLPFGEGFPFDGTMFDLRSFSGF